MKFNPSNHNRDVNDFFPTPPEATHALLLKEKFNGPIWECANGEGHLSNVLIKDGYEVKTSDITTGTDFLQQTSTFENIVTNPPFSLATEFATHAKSLASRKVALLLRLAFLESQKRHQFFLDKKFPLKTVYVFSKRIRMAKNILMKTGGMVPYAWFVWDREHIGPAAIDWVI